MKKAQFGRHPVSGFEHIVILCHSLHTKPNQKMKHIPNIAHITVYYSWGFVASQFEGAGEGNVEAGHGWTSVRDLEN